MSPSTTLKEIERNAKQRAKFDRLFAKLISDHGPQEAVAMMLFWLADAADDIAYAMRRM